jgi:leucyl-tRNA---protein transferase
MLRTVPVRWIPPPRERPKLGRLFVLDDDCWHYDRHRGATLAMVYDVHALTREDRSAAVQMGMFSIGAFVFRPVCDGCRKCQPFRVAVERFETSKSQRRVQRRCDGRFKVEIGKPRVDDERLELYVRYRAAQHGDHEASAIRQELEHVATRGSGGIELSWRDNDGKLVAIGLLDEVDDGLVSELFFWEPDTERYSLGVYSSLYEIELCRARGKPFYYLGPLVHDARRTRYKALYAAGEIWDGTSWLPMPSRDLTDSQTLAFLEAAEARAKALDDERFRLDLAVADDGAHLVDLGDDTDTVWLDAVSRGPEVSLAEMSAEGPPVFDEEDGASLETEEAPEPERD